MSDDLPGPADLPPGAQVRVVIAADIRLYRDGLVRTLEQRAPIHIVGTAASGEEALACVARLRPDVVLLDMAMRTSDAVARASAAAGAKVIALGVSEADGGVLACAELGLAGYVTRDASLDDLVAAVECAARGELRCSPRAAATLFQRLAALAAERAPHPSTEQLTLREREIVALIDRGLSNKEIARRLCIEVATVKNHVHNILEKLRVSRRGEAAARVRGARIPAGADVPLRSGAVPELSS